MYALLVWSTGMRRPFHVTGGNGLPTPTIARPSVHARDVGGARFGERGRIRERHDHRPCDAARHLADDGLVECAGDAGHADQHGRPHVAHDVEEPDASGRARASSRRPPHAAARTAAWNGSGAGPPSTSNPSRSTQKEPPPGFGRIESRRDHRAASSRMRSRSRPSRRRGPRCADRLSAPPLFASAASSVPVATAAVPCTSSLNVQSRSR